MIVALTGTPGTGKTSVAKILEKNFKVVYLKNFKDARIGYDADRDSYIMDLEKIKKEIDNIKQEGTVIIEGHFAHEMDADIVIVLRCHPDVLKKRLSQRDYKDEKIMENLEAEAMSLITSEAILIHGKDKVFEIDTTDRVPEECADLVMHIIKTKDKRFAPHINYSEEILKWY